MEGDFIKINESLLPFSWLYGLGVGVRNLCFEVGVLKSRDFKVPVISVGNITVGGTGKTPHVEYLIRLLKDKFRVAVLSRGYKRSTNGYILASMDSTEREIGDEPYQMKQKFPDVSVAVDKKRVRGIQQLTDNDQSLDIVLLDDAFQHRYVKPGINILLVDYHRLIIYDKLLPAGRLREPESSKSRADIVIVTKCPKQLKPMEYRVLTKAMNLYPYQQLFFTTLQYDDPYPVFAQHHQPMPLAEVVRPETNVLLLTSIASPRQLEEDLAKHSSRITPLTFSDHHNFTPKDVRLINKSFLEMPSPKCIITTEKDATRMHNLQGLSDTVRQNIYALPVRISFIRPEQEEKFNENIIGYVRKNSRNSILAQRKDDHKVKDNNHSGNGTQTISF